MNTKSPHLDPVWLRQKYEAEGLSTYEIGAIVGRDPKRIHEKLRDFGIQTRLRGANLRGEDCYMKRPGAVNYRPAKDRAASVLRRESLPNGRLTPSPHANPVVPTVLFR